jgi:hypothetical protein
MDAWRTNLPTLAPKATLNSVRTPAQVIAGEPTTACAHLTGCVSFSTKVTATA